MLADLLQLASCAPQGLEPLLWVLASPFRWLWVTTFSAINYSRYRIRLKMFRKFSQAIMRNFDNFVYITIVDLPFLENGTDR